MTHSQSPIGSPFNAATTAAEAIQGIGLQGKTAVVTGGYSGLGLETVRVLVAAGAHVVVPARDTEKARRDLADLLEVAIETLDLMDPSSINTFTNRFLSTHRTLDLLIDCAGVMANPLTRDARGYESQFSTNVLGHYQLTCQLWPALVAADGARVVILSSANHRVNVAALLADPNFERTEYDPWKAYAQSKAANALLAVGLDLIGEPENVRVFAVHPGGIYATGLLRHIGFEVAKQAGMVHEDGTPNIDPENGWKTPEQGPGTIVWAATSPLLDGMGGLFCANCEVARLLDEDEGPLVDAGVSPGAVDPNNASRLLEICQDLTGTAIN